MDLVAVGTIALDDVKTPFGEVKSALGGSATYFGLAAGYFVKPGIIGVVGEDFPPQHLNFLKDRGIDICGVEEIKGKTFHWSGEYRYDMNEAETLQTDLNVLADFDPKIPESYRECGLLFLANIDPDIQLKVLEEVNPRKCFCDTMNFWIDGKRDSLTRVFERVDGIIINDGEARQYCETPSLVEAGKTLASMNDGIVIIKKGEHGCMYFNGKDVFVLPAFPVTDLVDPTGAGDSFAGATLGHLAKHGDYSDKYVRKSIVCGSAVASHVISGFSVGGLRDKTVGDIECRYQQFKNLVQFE